MFPYLVNVFVTICCVCFATSQKKQRVGSNFLGFSKKKFDYRWLVLILLSWVVLYSLKGTTGTDAGGYWRYYKGIYINNIPLNYCVKYHRDKLFEIINWFFSNLFSGYWIPACAIYSIILYFPIVFVIYKKSINPGFSCLLYIFTMAIYFGYNGLRQGLSMGFAFIAFYIYFVEKRYILYTLFMAISYGFHSAAMLVIPFHFIMLQKWKSLKSVIIVFGFIFFYIFIVQYWGSMIGLMDMLGQEKMVADYGTLHAGDANHGSWLRVMVSVVVLFVGCVKYKSQKIRFKDYDIDIWLFVFSVLTTIFMRKFVYFSRLGAYIDLGLFLSLPKLVYVFEEKNKKMIVLFIGLLYFLYMVSLLLHGDADLYPYKPVWSNGKF